MATCPEIPIFEEDPFIFYARYLIRSFRQVYGTDVPSFDGQTVFEYSAGIHNTAVDNAFADGRVFGPDEYIGDLSTSETATVLSATSWISSLPLYIRGPAWDALSSYREDPWDVHRDDETGWFDLAGALVVHPMLMLEQNRYGLAFVVNEDADDLVWNDWYSVNYEVADAFSETTLTTPGIGVPVPTLNEEVLKFGFLLEVLDAFIHIHDTGGTSLSPDMDPFTWCQMFWSGYETNQPDLPRKHLGKGTSGTERGDGWDGELNPPGSPAKIIYVPRADESYSVSNIVGDGSLSTQPEDPGPIHATSVRKLADAVQGHSVKIENADYEAFLFWLRKALEILDSESLGPLNRGPAREGLAGDDFLSQVFISAGVSPKLSVAQCQITGAPYGGLSNATAYENQCNIEIYRAMADRLYFDSGPGLPLSNDLSIDSINYWNDFLQEHSVSVSISTAALNESILSSGVAGEDCTAVDLNSSIPNLGLANIDAASCKAPPLDDQVVDTYLTCIKDPKALIPNWINQTEQEPFLNKRTCEYSIVMLADPPSCSDEYLNTFIPDAVNKLLDYYGKDANANFLDLSDNSETSLNSADVLINGSGGLYLEGIQFVGTAKVKTFFIPPRPLAKTKVLITIDAEEFNRIPERQAQVQDFMPVPEYFDGEPSFVVFRADEMESIFDKVSYAYGLYDRFYAQWHLQTGKTIRGLYFKDEAERIDSFFKETDLLIRESGYTISNLDWLEIGFSPEYKVEYIKVQEKNTPPILIDKGFNSYIERSPMSDSITAAYVSQLPNMKNDLMAREPVSWLDMIRKYRFVNPEEVYSLDISSPVAEDNTGLQQASDLACPAGTSSGVFEPSLFGTSVQRQKWAESQINDIKGALLSQLSANPCALVDARILEHQGRTDFALQITDMTLKEYLTSDRFINDLPELLVRGRFNDLTDLYGGMLDNLGMCGLVDLIKSAVDCALNALGYDDAITIIVGAAIRGMDDEFLSKFVNNLSPEMQQVVIASINEVAPDLLPFLAGMVSVEVTDSGGLVIQPVYDRRASYTSREVPLGSLGDRAFVGTVETPGSKTSELTLSTPPGQIGSLGMESRAATPQDYGRLKDAIYELVINDFLEIDELLRILNNLPGAGIAVNILSKIDKFCVAPPLFYPPLTDFLQLPGVTIDFCELDGGIKRPIFPKLRFNSLSKILIDNAFRVLEELLIRLLILILKKVLEIIAEELCKTRTGSDPLNLRAALEASLCAGSDIEPEKVDEALNDLISKLGCLTDSTAVGRLIDNVASVVTQCELVDLVTGEGSDNLYDLIVEIVKNDPITLPLSECLFDRPSVHSFFKSIGVFIDLEQLCIEDPTNLPVSREVCDNLGLLNVFRQTRAEALRAKGVDEECIEDQLCILRDQTTGDLQDLMSLLQEGIFDSVLPNIMKDPTSDKAALLPSEMPIEASTLENVYASIFDSMSLTFTEDIIGKRGFLNMVLADSRGRGYRQHLGFQNSVLGPTVLNIYGSRGTRTQPPRDEWGPGAASPNDGNEWVNPEGIPFSEDAKPFWQLPFLFNPLASLGNGDTETTTTEDDEDPKADDDGVIRGRPPAVGGLPDKVAGHLQKTLSELSVSFNTGRDYTTGLFWGDYDNEDAWNYVFEYDYWTEPPADQVHSWDGHRFKVTLNNESWKDDGEVYSEAISFFNMQSTVLPEVAELKEFFLSDYYLGGSSDPNSTFYSLVQYKTNQVLSVSQNDALPRFNTEYGSNSADMNSAFEKTNRRIIEFLAESVATSDGASDSPFDYGFDPEKAPVVKYFHDEEFDGDIAAAVAKYGGSINNPPFYLKQPEVTGFLKIAQQIIPEFNPCEDSDDVVTFPEFNSLRTVCSEFSSAIPVDERAFRKVEGVSQEVERPFDRHLTKASLGVIEGSIFATIRLYVVDVLMNSIPVLRYLGLSDTNYAGLLAEFIIDKMEIGMKDVGRGIRFREVYEDYWWLFLEQVVQNFGIKVNQGIITDVTPEEQEAFDFINNYVEENWEWILASDVSGGIFPAKKVAKQRKEAWNGVFKSTEDIDSPIIRKAKVILSRYIREEYERTTQIFSKAVTPIYRDINDIILKKPDIVRGAISSPESGPFDVPEAAYYESRLTDAPETHPYDLKTPSIINSKTPFVLERYVTTKGSTDKSVSLSRFGSVANIFDGDAAIGGQQVDIQDEMYFGLRLSFVPGAIQDSSLEALFESALGDVDQDVSYTLKAFGGLYKNIVPLASAEIQFTTSDGYDPTLYNQYIQLLVCKLIETPEYKTLFTHCFPMPKYMDILAIYCANTFVPSLARVEDGWAAKTKLFGGAKKESGGGRWIGAGKNGGMNTWRGNEGTKNSFMKTKILARQTLEAACYTNYDYRDRDYMSPSEVYIENIGSNSDGNPNLKWWQWSSLRPAPCKLEDE